MWVGPSPSPPLLKYIFHASQFYGVWLVNMWGYNHATNVRFYGMSWKCDILLYYWLNTHTVCVVTLFSRLDSILRLLFEVTMILIYIRFKWLKSLTWVTQMSFEFIFVAGPTTFVQSRSINWSYLLKITQIVKTKCHGSVKISKTTNSVVFFC